MPSLPRLTATVLMVFTGLGAIASPAPLPFSRMPSAYSYAEHIAREVKDTTANFHAIHKPNHTAPPYAIHSTAAIEHKIMPKSILTELDLLNSYAGQANTHATNIQSLSSKASNSSSYQQQVSTEFGSYQSSLLGLQNTLHDLGADKGLQNYDKSNQLETLLKDMVNANKDALMSLTQISYEVPGLGSTLGPLAYDIKCVIEAFLDFSENALDGMLNSMVPELQPLVGQWGQAGCSLGLLSLCI